MIMSCPREENKQYPLNKLLEHVSRYSSDYSDWINYYTNVTVTSAGLNLNPNTNVNAVFGTVGIGTTAPNQALTVIGGISGTGGINFSGILNGATAQNILTLKADGTVEYRTPAQILTDIGAGSSGGALLGSGTVNYIPRWTGAANLGNSQIFDNNTNVGIGTITPNHKLTVTGNVSSGGIVYSSNNNSDNWSSVFTNVQSNSANWQSTYTTVRDTSANWQSTYTTVQNTSANWQSAYTTLTANSANYILQNGNTLGQALLIGTNDNFNLNLETNNTNRLTILNTGNVGIGTTNPNQTLTVVGTISSSGNITAGTLATGSTNNVIIHSSNTLQQRTINSQMWNTSDVFVTSNYAGITQGYVLRQAAGSAPKVDIGVLYDSGTNVGISTTTPNQKLTVVGSISATGSIYAPGTVIKSAYIETGAPGTPNSWATDNSPATGYIAYTANTGGPTDDSTAVTAVSTSYTPLEAGNTLVIQGVIPSVDHSAGNTFVSCILKAGSTVLTTGVVDLNSTYGNVNNIPLMGRFTTTSTTPITIAARIGAMNAGTLYTGKCTLLIQEIKGTL